jgi:predicted metal-dependent hydrolase
VSESDPLPVGLAAAARRFNAAEFHAAHELLDELWENAVGRDSDFLKGLIQACIALHHLQAENLHGARKLYAGHRQLLAGYLPAYRGLDVAAFLAGMQSALQPALHAGAERGPFPRLEFAAGA